ncbi:MAG TPA: DEAD/DEAH box helicase [Candidatus Avacidaminococcus intestinavium]|uniref:ATP-dependent RNA helicase CshA n=1 Tax=Candidatus Avacidaminococcus intestinavium TaxID=2840684 RepID=A0A9D1MPZ2_9FIRM|nr:DEAD/DEAH box helicase [Candidatus Avacidaminococcus intestinavium]
MTTNTKENFGELLLDKKIVTALTDMGFEEPSPIQRETIPFVLEGNDVIGQAQTGTGKTAAFGIPIIQNIADSRHIQALIMTPTRELAIQVAEEVGKIGRTSRIKALPVYGGQPIDRQIRALKSGVQIVIGTPGRLLDHLHRGTIKLDGIRFLVVDEADEMLDMGFIEDMEEIMKNLPVERQTLLFSATMPRPILSLTKKYMKAPKVVAIHKEVVTAPSVDQFYYETKDKVDGLSRLLDVEINGKLIIFCRTKKGVDELVIALGTRGYLAEGLHGDLSQNQRDRVMKKFRAGRVDILIATDVAARGLDIENITHVVNFDIPQDPESYVHRIGRTGRAGNKGVALTFITPREFRQLKLIERAVNIKIIRRQLPTDANVLEKQREIIVSKLQSVLDQNNYGEYLSIISTLTKDYSVEDVAAAAVKLMQEGSKALEISSETRVMPSDFTNTGARPGMVRMFMNIGRSQKITVKDIIQTIAIEADIPGKVIGTINIYDKFTFVEIPEDVAEKVLAVMHKNTIKGYKVNVEPARARD